MVSKQILQFKCVVNLCDQDLGAFCRERDPEEEKNIGEEQQATEPPAGWALGALVEDDAGSGGPGWCFWAALAILEVCMWLWELRSLLGWLWWHWEFGWGQ